MNCCGEKQHMKNDKWGCMKVTRQHKTRQMCLNDRAGFSIICIWGACGSSCTSYCFLSVSSLLHSCCCRFSLEAVFIDIGIATGNSHRKWQPEQQPSGNAPNSSHHSVLHLTGFSCIQLSLLWLPWLSISLDLFLYLWYPCPLLFWLLFIIPNITCSVCKVIPI